MPPIEIDARMLLLIPLIVLATFIANIFVGAKVAQRVGVGSMGDYFIGFIAGVVGTVVPLFFIRGSFPFVAFEFVLTFIITAGLAWVIAKWARMGAKSDN